MKILFFSDVHGVYDNLEILKKLDEVEHFDKIILLGDVLYHYGKEVRDKDRIIKLLNSFQDRIVGIRGNCDSIEDINTLKFIKNTDYITLNLDNIKIGCTHGHIYNINNSIKDVDILIYGHEHFPYIKKHNNTIYINVGSISLPRMNSIPSFCIYKDNKFIIYTINNTIVDEINI